MKIIKNEYISLMIKMSIPVLMNYLVLTLFEVIDKAIVGNYALDDFAAVGVSATVIFGITGSLGAISVAFNIMAANTLGSKDTQKFNHTFTTVMNLSFLIGIIIIILAFMCGNSLFKVVYGLEGNILTLCEQYFKISSFTILFNLLNFNFSVYFRNIKNTKVTLYSTIVATSSNLIFDYILVYGKFGFPELGANGAALGSVLGLLAGALIYVLKVKQDGQVYINLKLERNIAKQILKLYLPLFGQDFMEGTIFMLILTAIVSRLSIHEMASYHLAETIAGILALPIYAFSTTATTLALQESSANAKNDARIILNIALFLSVSLLLLMGGLVLIFPHQIFGLMTNNQMVITNVTRIFAFVIVVQIFNCFNQLYKSYLQGIGCEKFVFAVTCIISLTSVLWISVLSIKFSVAGIYIGLALNYFIFALLYKVKITHKTHTV